MSDLIENSRILIFASAFNLLRYVVLIEVHEETVGSDRCVIGKEKILFQIIIDSLYSLVLHQNLKSDSLLKFRCVK